MKLHNNILVLLLIFLGVNANQQKAHAAPPPIPWDELARVMDRIELNYQSPYLWMRYSILMSPNDPTKIRLCYKMDMRRMIYPTRGWVSTFNYVLNDVAPTSVSMTDPEAAWCWQ